MSYKKYQ